MEYTENWVKDKVANYEQFKALVYDKKRACKNLEDSTVPSLAVLGLHRLSNFQESETADLVLS